MADIKIATYSDIINAGGKIKSGISYTSYRCAAKNAIANFSNAAITDEGTSKLGTQLININEFTIVSTSATLTSIITGSYEKGSGGSSAVRIIATYSDGTTRDVTALCTVTVTNASTIGVATWNSSTLTIYHGAQGTATLNASYTEAGVTKTVTAQITTTSVFPIGYTINPSFVAVEVGKTVNVSVIGHLNNDNNTVNGFTYSYVNGYGSEYFSFDTISGGIAVSGIAIGSGKINVEYSSGLGASTQIPVTVMSSAKLVISAAEYILKNTSKTGQGSIYFKTYDTDGNELSSTDVLNDCTLSVNNDLLTVANNDNTLEFVAGNTVGTSIITATYTYNGNVYTATHTVFITDPTLVYVTNVDMRSEPSVHSYYWVMAVQLSDGSTEYPQYTAECTMSQADSSYVGRTFSGPFLYEAGSSWYTWEFTATSDSAFYDSSGAQIYPSASGSINAVTIWRP